MTPSLAIFIVLSIGIILIVIIYKISLKLWFITKEEGIKLKAFKHTREKNKLFDIEKDPNHNLIDAPSISHIDWIYNCRVSSYKSKRNYTKTASIIFFLLIPIIVLISTFLALTIHISDIENDPYYVKRVGYSCDQKIEAYGDGTDGGIQADYEMQFYKYCVADPKTICVFNDVVFNAPKVRCYNVYKRKPKKMASELISIYPFNKLITVHQIPDFDKNYICHFKVCSFNDKY